MRNLHESFSLFTLVSHTAIPEWEQKAIKGLAVQNDLYTIFSGGHEIDEFERWIQREYEDPGLDATEKIITGGRLTPMEWNAIQRYAAAQDLRTPLNFLETMERWRINLPGLVDQVLQDAVESMKRARAEDLTPLPSRNPSPYCESIKVEVQHPADRAANHGTIQMSVKPGRRMWITGVRQKLIDNVSTICRERWSVIEPFGDEEWPLTDQPVVRLNFCRLGHYGFKGGWGIQGTEIMMPISPRHLLYVRVGRKLPNRFVLSQDTTRQVQTLLVQRAYRWIFARGEAGWVVQARPRIVDEAQFREEKLAWEKWNEVQLKHEMS